MNWFVRGLLRLAAWLVGAAGVIVGIAIAIGHARGASPARSAAVGLYSGGAAFCLLAVIGAAGRGGISRVGYGEPLRGDLSLKKINALRVEHLVFGLGLIGPGVLVDRVF